jgi:hypothetical protein
MHSRRSSTTGLTAFASVALAVWLTGCGGSNSQSGNSVEVTSRGQFGVFYNVVVPHPVGGTITSIDGKINCGAPAVANACGPVQYLWTTSATLQATPDTGHAFVGWAGDCKGGGDCLLDNTFYGADKTVAAVFSEGTSYGLRIAKTNAGEGTVTVVIPGSPTATCAASEMDCAIPVPVAVPPLTVTLTASPDASSHFVGWSGPCAGSGLCTVQMGGPVTVVATFDRGPTGTTTVTPSGGTVTTSAGVSLTVPAGAVTTDTPITVTVLADPPPDSTAVGPIYDFQPSGLVFAQPITLTFPIPPGTTDVEVYWTTPDGTGYEPVGGAIVGDTIQAQVTHFSRGFVAARTYAVGGTVSGVAGTGLTLASPGEPNLVVPAGSSAFTFAKKLARGAAYSVSVAQQPSTPAQNCVVTTGTGTVARAPVTNIAVSCTTVAQYFTLGGTASGLAGSVSLSDGNGQALTVGLNGPFTFGTALPSGTPYAVSITAQPSNGTCSVTNGTGTIAAANVSGVAVNCSCNAGYVNAGGCVPRAPTSIEFSVQPGDIVAGAPLHVQVAVLDQGGQLFTSGTFPVALSMSTGLQGTTTVSTINGVADFTDLTSTIAGASYTLFASASGVGASISTPFAVAPAAPDPVASAVHSTSIQTAGGLLFVQAEVKDAFGNRVPGTSVHFTASGTANTFSPTDATTDSYGVASVYYSSTKAEQKVLTGWLSGGTVPMSGTWAAVINPGGPSASTSTLAAVPATAIADGTSSITLAR